MGPRRTTTTLGLFYSRPVPFLYEKGKKSKKKKGAGGFFRPTNERERERSDEVREESGEDKKEIAPQQKALAPRRED